MKSKMYLVEFMKDDSKEIIVVRNPQNPSDVHAFTSVDELGEFLRKDVVKVEPRIEPKTK